MPTTTTCFDFTFQWSKARDCFSCMRLIPGSLVAGNQRLQERHGTFFASHKKSSWLLLCSLGFCARSCRTHRQARSHSLAQPKAHSQPIYVLAMLAAGLRFKVLLSHATLIAMPHKTSALCNLALSRLHKLPQSAALAHSIHCVHSVFRRAARVIAMKYCNHFCHRTAQGCFTSYTSSICK